MKHYYGNKKYQNGYTFTIEITNCDIMTGYFKGKPYFLSSDGLRMLEINDKLGLQNIIYHTYLWTGYGWKDGGNAGHKINVALTWLSTGQLIYE